MPNDYDSRKRRRGFARKKNVLLCTADRNKHICVNASTKSPDPGFASSAPKRSIFLDEGVVVTLGAIFGSILLIFWRISLTILFLSLNPNAYSERFGVFIPGGGVWVRHSCPHCDFECSRQEQCFRRILASGSVIPPISSKNTRLSLSASIAGLLQIFPSRNSKFVMSLVGVRLKHYRLQVEYPGPG